jgi:uncharacterized protein (TIGR03067 family)
MPKIVLLFGVAIASVALGAAPPPKLAPAIRAEQKKLVGRWLLQKVQREGRTTWDARDHEREHILTIEGARWLSHESHPDAKTKMAAFDVESKAFDVITTFRGHTFHSEAIYKIEGESLSICYRRGKGNRPTSFDTSKEEGTALNVYKRVKR